MTILPSLPTSLLSDSLVDGPAPVSDSASTLDGLSASLVAKPTVVSHDRLSSILLWDQRTTVRLLMLSYIPVSVVALSYFNPVSVGAYGERLVDWPTISTASPQYARLILVMALVIAVAVCGLPIGMFAMLAREHRRGTPKRMQEDVQVLHATGQHHALSLPTSDSALVGDDTPLLTRMRLALVMQLCVMYRPQYWWYPVFLLVRRLIVVPLLVFIDDASVWIWLTLANTLLLTVHILAQPYSKPVCNAMETLTLLALVMQTTLLCRWPPPFMTHWLLSVPWCWRRRCTWGWPPPWRGGHCDELSDDCGQCSSQQLHWNSSSN